MVPFWLSLPFQPTLSSCPSQSPAKRNRILRTKKVTQTSISGEPDKINKRGVTNTNSKLGSGKWNHQFDEYISIRFLVGEWLHGLELFHINLPFLSLESQQSLPFFLQKLLILFQGHFLHLNDLLIHKIHQNTRYLSIEIKLMVENFQRKSDVQFVLPKPLWQSIELSRVQQLQKISFKQIHMVIRYHQLQTMFSTSKCNTVRVNNQLVVMPKIRFQPPCSRRADNKKYTLS